MTDRNSLYAAVLKVNHAGGSGSCFYLKRHNLFVTNYHVIEGFHTVALQDNDRRAWRAHVVLANPARDIALLAAEGDFSTLPELTLATEEPLIGDKIRVAGYPFGMPFTLTEGSISSPDQLMDGSHYIQTDAAVNPGNSGGALVNTHGELVGINTLIQSQTGSYVGYSFAVPESIVRKVVMDLKEYGVVQRAMLGITFRPVDQAFLDSEGKELGIDELGGVYVASVLDGGAASEAGIRKGDIILDIDGVKLEQASTLQEQVAKHRPNDKVKLSVKRDGKVKQMEVTLRNKAGKTELLTREDVDVVEILGGKFADAGSKLCRELDIRGGVQVVSIKADGILARARVREGFVITHINDHQVLSLADLQRMTEKVRSIDGIYPNGRAASYVLVE